MTSFNRGRKGSLCEEIHYYFENDLLAVEMKWCGEIHGQGIIVYLWVHGFSHLHFGQALAQISVNRMCWMQIEWKQFFIFSLFLSLLEKTWRCLQGDLALGQSNSWALYVGEGLCSPNLPSGWQTLRLLFMHMCVKPTRKSVFCINYKQTHLNKKRLLLKRVRIIVGFGTSWREKPNGSLICFFIKDQLQGKLCF